MVDEAGVNHQALVRIFGEQVHNKTVICQWHFWSVLASKFPN